MVKINYDVIFSAIGASALTNHINKLNNGLKDLDKNQKKGKDSATSITSKFDIFGKVADGLGKKIKDYGTEFARLGGKASTFGTVVASFGAGFEKSRKSGSGLFGSLTGGFGNMTKFMKGASISTTSVIVGMGSALFAILGPIALIGAAVFVLQRIWKNNIGGIQSTFRVVWGQIRTAFARFVIEFDKGLRKLGPIIKVVVDILGKGFLNSLKAIGIVTKVIFSILNPIFDVLGQIGTEISNFFKELNIGGSGAINVLETIGDVLVGIGKFVGTVLGESFKIVLLVVKAILAVLKPIVQAIKMAYDVAVKLGIVKEDTAKKDQQDLQAKEKQVKVIKQASTAQGGNQTTVNNNPSVTVNSAGPITPESSKRIGNTLASSIMFDMQTL